MPFNCGIKSKLSSLYNCKTYTCTLIALCHDHILLHLLKLTILYVHTCHNVHVCVSVQSFLIYPGQADTHSILSLQAKNSHCARLVVDKQLCTQQYGITTTKLSVTIQHYGVNYDLFFSIPSLLSGFLERCDKGNTSLIAKCR